MVVAPEIVASISLKLAQHAGLELPVWVVEARAAQRIAALSISPSAYVELIGTPRGAGELDELIEAVRVGETRLFRHRSQIQAVIDVVVPAIKARHKRAIRVWSAGCAAGEEPYTLAAVLAQALPSVTVSIVATDVSADALEVAKTARYPATAWNHIPEAWRDGFIQDHDGVRVDPAIAGLVKFERGNLAAAHEPSPLRGCDLVWCRNVLIYFTPAARKKVVDRLIASLAPGGFLFVGYSESLRDIPALETRRAGDASFYVRRDIESAVDPRITPPAGILKVTGEHPPIAISRTMTPGVLVVHGVTKTPALVEELLALHGSPSARAVTGDLMSRLAQPGLSRLVVDLDTADLLEDDLAPVLRRARAAARAAQVILTLRATRTGSRRWLTRHQLDEGDS